MRSLNKDAITNSFIRRPKDLYIPDLSAVDWTNIEFFGWLHRSGHLGYISVEHYGKLVSIEFEIQPASNDNQYKICTFCHTQHISTGISLFTYTIKRPEYKTYGEWICSNLQCSKYVRNQLDPLAIQMREDLSREDKILRLKMNINSFISTYLKNSNYH